jgi:hypothetical protein
MVKRSEMARAPISADNSTFAEWSVSDKAPQPIYFVIDLVMLLIVYFDNSIVHMLLYRIFMVMC